MHPTNKTARVAGALYLLNGVTGFFCIMYAPADGAAKCAGIREGARPTVVRFLKIRRSLVPWGFARGFALLPAPDDIVFRRQEFTRANRPGRAVQFRTSNSNCGHAPGDFLVARTLSI